MRIARVIENLEYVSEKIDFEDKSREVLNLWNEFDKYYLSYLKLLQKKTKEERDEIFEDFSESLKNKIKKFK